MRSDIPFSTGTERRLFRGRFHDFITHINNFVDITGGDIKGWVDSNVGLGGEDGWSSLRSAFEEVKFNGPWASYKFADLIKHVHKYDITANDIGVGGGSQTAGPIPGMVKLTGRDWKECARDVGLQKGLLKESIGNGVPFDGLDQLRVGLAVIPANNLPHQFHPSLRQLKLVDAETDRERSCRIERSS